MAGGKLVVSLMAVLAGLLVGAGCSSDSQTVVFTSDRNGSDSNKTSGIYLASSGSEDVSRLTAPGLTS